MQDKPPNQEIDEKIITQLSQEIEELAKKPNISLDISPLAAWSLILQIQLAGRHPANQNWMFDRVKQFVHQMESALQLSDWLKEYISKGWNPELDVPVENDLSTAMGIVIPKEDYVLNNLALGVACQMLVEQSCGGLSLKQVVARVQEIAKEQLDQLTPDLIEKAVAESKQARL